MKNILIVEDDAFFRLVLLSGLGPHLRNFNFLTACNGREAVDILKSLPVDFVLTDLYMDGMDGFQLLEYVNANHSGVPVAIMSGEHSQTVKERLGRMGVSTYFEKPFDLKEVEAEIQGALGNRPAREVGRPVTRHNRMSGGLATQGG